MDVYQKDKLSSPADPFRLDHDGRSILDRIFETTQARHLSDAEISARLKNAGLSPDLAAPAPDPDLAASAAPLPGENS